jgi:hypothetical protein
MIIKIYSSFSSSSNCKTVYEKLCEAECIDYYGKNKEIYITDGEDYTHVIIQNTAMPDIKHIPKENVLGLSFEPQEFLELSPEFIKYAIKYIGKYFIGDNSGLPYPFIEHFGYIWHKPPIRYIPIKKNRMSMMISKKYILKGHIYRHLLVDRILKSQLPIDIYGSGCKYYNVKDDRLKGGFRENEILYESYDFHICIENSILNEYFSEKLINTFLYHATPLYIGCNNIEKYFPDCVIHLSGYIEKDMELFKSILNNPEKYKKKINIEKIKSKINLIKNIKKVFRD